MEVVPGLGKLGAEEFEFGLQYGDFAISLLGPVPTHELAVSLWPVC